MERTIRKDGFLFWYAYWFISEDFRPSQVNRCPFFWRLMRVTFVEMPLYWLLWVPFSFVTGFLFATRPRIFSSDGYLTTKSHHGQKEPGSPWVSYKHWPQFRGRVVRPIAVLGWMLAPLVLLSIINQLGHTDLLWGHTALFWIGCALGVVVAGLLVLGGVLSAQDKLKDKEWYQMTVSWYKERKQGICPSYKVV